MSQDSLVKTERGNNDLTLAISQKQKCVLLVSTCTPLGLYLCNICRDDLSNSVYRIYIIIITINTGLQELLLHKGELCDSAEGSKALNANVLFTVQCGTAFLEEAVFPTTAVTQHEELLNISFQMNKAS